MGVEGLPGVPDHRPGGILVGRLEPSGQHREVLPCDGQRRPAHARYEHEVIECVRSDVRTRGERNRGRARRRVLQPRHGSAARATRTQGELDIATAGDVERELQRVELTGPLVVAVDLRELTFVDSTAIRLIFEAQQRASRGSWRLLVVRGAPAVQRSFEVCGLADQLPFVDALPVGAATGAAGTAARRGGATARDECFYL